MSDEHWTDLVEIELENRATREKRLSEARRESIKVWTANIEAACSAYELQQTGHADSFCSMSVSTYNPFLRYFQTFSCLFTAICLFLAPYQYFFRSSDVTLFMNAASDMVYLLIVLYRSRTSLMIAGIEERSLLKIRKRYQSSVFFLLDVITFLPLAIQLWPFSDFDPEFFALVRLTIFVRIHYVIYFLALRENESGSSTLLYRTTKYVFLSSLCIHIAACGWYGLACSRAVETEFTLDLCDRSSWIRFLPQNIIKKVTDATIDNAIEVPSDISFLHNTYITSMYWASATVTSTGFGDIHAFTGAEKVFSIFAMLLGMSILYGMTLGGMTSMLVNIDAKRAKFVHQYQTFEKEVNRMGVTSEVKLLCLNYFDYLWRRWEGEDVQSKPFLNILPECTRASFTEKRFYNFLHKADLLQNAEEAFFRNLSLACKSTVYLENQFIQKSGEICSTMFYLHSGIVEVLDDTETEVVALMHPGKIFGQVMLVYDLPRINSIRCRTNCDVFVLEKNDFKNVISDYPESAARFLNSAKSKCNATGSLWPIEPPNESQLSRFVEKTANSRLRMRSFSSFDSPVSSEATIPVGSRMRTVHSTNYSGVKLSRVQLRKQSTDVHEMTRPDASGKKSSLVDFITSGRFRSSTHLEDGTKVIASRLQFSDLKDAVGSDAGYSDPDDISWKRKVFELTLVDPKGKFQNFWLDYLFIISFITGLYTTAIAFFATTAGEQKLYVSTGDDDNFGLDFLLMAVDTCNQTLVNIYEECPSWPFNDTVLCIRNSGGSFSQRVFGDETIGYSLHLPSRSDISRCPYNYATTEGRFHYLFSILVIDFSFYLNIFINFRTKVFTPNGFLKKFKDIARNYNKWNKLWLDIFGVIPFEIMAYFYGCSRIDSYNATAFFRLNRVIYFFRYVPSTFARWEYRLNVKVLKIRIIKCIVYIYAITHVCSCVFFFSACGKFAQRNVDNIIYKCRFGSWAWVFDVSYLTSHLEDYIKTMYWASSTMTSTGYGDISATNTNGRVFAVMTMIVGTVMYGWLIAIIASTISNSEEARVTFTNSMLDTKNYLAVHGVSQALIHRTMDVRRLEWKRYAGTALPGEQKIGKQLSKLLQDTLFYESLCPFMERLPFFHNVDPAFIATLCKYVKIYHYSEGDMVLYEGDLSRNLYVLKRGRCAMISQDLSTRLAYLTEGDYFGECEMLFGCGSPRTVVAETTCDLLTLGRDDMDAALTLFPTLQAQMAKIEEDVTYRDRILKAIKTRAIVPTAKRRAPLTEYYNIETIEGGIRMYSKRKTDPSFTIKLNQCFWRLGKFDKFLTSALMHLSFVPLSRGYLIYETIRVLFIITTMIIIPLQFSFLPSNTPLMVLFYVLDGLTLCDQFIKFHTCYYTPEGIFVSYPARCAQHYFRTSCLVDFLSWFPFEVFMFARFSRPMAEEQWRFLGMMRLTRMLQLYKVDRYFRVWLTGMHGHNRTVKTARNTLYGLLLHHWCACFLFLCACPPQLDRYDTSQTNAPGMMVLNTSGAVTLCVNSSWVANIPIEGLFPSLDVEYSVWDQYILSLYWATCTAVCVGYGDIHAYRPVEMLATMLVQIGGTVYFSYILGGMSASVQTDDARRSEYKTKLSDIARFFKVYNISKETENQVLSYHCYLWNRTGGVSPSKLFTGLPFCLRTSICQTMYGAMIREAFDEGDSSDDETQGFYRLLTRHITPALYMKNGIICRRNDIGNEMFFIQRGNVAILDNDDETPIKFLGPGQHFGEVAMLFELPREKSIKAATNCELNILSKKDLDGILAIFPQFRKKMTAIAQDRQLRGVASTTYEHRKSSTPSVLLMSSLRPREVAPLTTTRKIFREDDIKFQVRSSSYQQILKVPPERRVVDKESPLSALWNHVIVALSFLSVSICIYQVSLFSHYVPIYVVGYFIDFWFLVDMMITFHSSFTDQFGTNVDSLQLISVRYAKSLNLFLLDLVSNAPLELVSVFTPDLHMRLSILCYARLNRVLRLYRMYSIFKSWTEDIRHNAALTRMYGSLLCVCFIANFTGCVFVVFACPGGNCQEGSWMSKLKSMDEYQRRGFHQFSHWISSLYWSVCTITSTGYGDIRPLRKAEMLYACGVMVLGKLVIGYVLGMLAATIANEERFGVTYKQEVSAVKSCMADHKFNRKLSQHIVQYYEYMWMKNRAVNVMELFPDLPFSLRADIFSQICGKLVGSMALFKGCPDNFIRHLCMVMTPTAYMPGDYISLQGDVRSEAFVIYRGVAEAVKSIKNHKITIRLVMEGENFLCESLLCQIRRPCSLRARTYVDAFSMTMEGLQSVLKHHPAIYVIILSNARALYPELKF